MNPDYEKQLEAAIRRELKALAGLAAPPEIAQARDARHRATRPGSVVSPFVADVAGGAPGCFARWAAGRVCDPVFWKLAVGTLRHAHPGGKGSLRLVQFGECGLERCKHSGKCAGAGVSESGTGSGHRQRCYVADLLRRVCWFGNSLLAARLLRAAERKVIMKKILRNILIWNGAATLSLLVLFSAPMNRAVAQTNEPAISAAAEAAQPRDRQDSDNSSHDLVVFCRSAELPAGETANDMVVIGGSATALGKVRQDLVAILGNVMVGDEAGGDTVAVLGNIKLGTNAVVHGDTVAVLGNIKMGPNAKVHGDVVAVGGAVERSKGSVVDGEVVGMPVFSWLGEWLDQCAFKLRPLAPQLGWLWAIAGMFLLIYILIAIALPRPVQACVDEITRRPVTTILAGLLAKILLPFVFLILVATGIGIFVIPFLLIAVMFAGMIGKVALLQYFGQQIGRQFNLTTMQKPLVAFLLGWVVITLLYLVPILGFIIYALTGTWALGTVVMAMFSGRRHEMPEQAKRSAAGFGIPARHGGNSGQCASHPSGHHFNRAGGRRDGITGRFGSGQSAARHASSSNFRRRTARCAAGHFTRVVLSPGRLLGAHGRGVSGYGGSGFYHRVCAPATRIYAVVSGRPAGIFYCRPGLFRRLVGMEGNHDWRNCAEAEGGAS